MKGGLEKIDRIAISFERTLKTRDGQYRKARVRDDNDNVFMVVVLDLGSTADESEYGWVFGKRALPWEGRKNLESSAGERVRRQLDGEGSNSKEDERNSQPE